MKKMKLVLTFAFAVAMFAATAQTSGFSYQAVVRNSAGELVSNSQVSVRVSLTNEDGSAIQYQETQSVTTNGYGVLSLTVGSGTITQGDFSKVDWASGNVWMKVEMDANGGDKYTDLGSTKLQSVPYAYYAANGTKGDKGDQGDKGEDGKGITSIADNGNGTLTINYTDGTSYVTPNLKGEQGPAGTGLTNKGTWATGTTYKSGDYVFAPSTSDASQNSMWILQTETLTSTTEPKEDQTNWIEFQAPKGEPGKNATIAIGSVTTVEAGTSASVVNTGSATDAVLNFTLPQGEDGKTAIVNIGETTTLPSGESASVSVDYNEANNESVLSFAIPKGERGVAGRGIESISDNGNGTLTVNYTDGTTYVTPNLKGEQGPAGTGLTNKGAWKSGTTYSAGDYVFAPSSANVNVNSMWILQTTTLTSSKTPNTDTGNWVEFEAPKGDKGDTGAQGVSVQNVSINSENKLVVNMSNGNTYVSGQSLKGAKGDTGVGVQSATVNSENKLVVKLTNGNTYTSNSLKGKDGKDGMDIKGEAGQMLVHNGTTWEATNAVTADGSLEVKETATGGEDDAIFAVKDKNGRVVFAVYPNSVYVYVDENEPGTKAAKRGFVVSSNRATKDGENADIFAVNTDGTQVFVDEDSTKAAKRGFVVSSNRATKDGEIADIFAVGSSGTQVYVDEDSTKAAKRGFAVSSNRATKDGETADIFAVGSSGTQVYVDEDSTKAAKRGFAVSSNRATKDGGNADIFAVGYGGTQVFVDEDSTKAAKRGFAVSSNRATKDGGNADILLVGAEGTQVFVDEDGTKAAKRGFAVSSNRATKEGKKDDIFAVSVDGTQVYIDDDGTKAAKRGFAVSSNRATKGNGDYFIVNTDSTRIYIDDVDDSKAAKRGFAVSSNRATKGESGDGFAVNEKTGSSNNNLFKISTGSNVDVVNNENRIYWYPTKNAFLVGNVVANPDIVGENSFSAGYQNKASGQYSQAMGYKSVASGKTSIAIGEEANASGISSFAFGKSTSASGESSVAIGDRAQSTNKNALSFGQSANAGGVSSIALGIEAKTTGQYAASLGYMSQATGLSALAMGYNTTASGSYSTATGYQTLASGQYSFAGGYFSRAQSTAAIAIGYQDTASYSYATALGYQAKASGQYSIALGYQVKSTATGATALGNKTKASGNSSTALGYNTNASGSYSTALGYETNASGLYSTALGNACKSTGQYSFSAGYKAEAKTNTSLAFGYKVVAEGANSFSVGQDVCANGNNSVAIGRGLISESFGEVVVGQYNDPLNSDLFSKTEWQEWDDDMGTEVDRIFTIGNGYYDEGRREYIRRNAFVVAKNGNVGIGTSNPSDLLQVEGGTLSVSDGMLYLDSGTDFNCHSSSVYFDSDKFSVSSKNNINVYSDGLVSLSSQSGTIKTQNEYNKLSVQLKTNPSADYTQRGVYSTTEGTRTNYGYYYAVYGEHSGSGYYNYGVYGNAHTSDEKGHNYGIYGTASGGEVSYAGYFVGNVKVTGDINYGSLTKSSDERLKKDIQTIGGALDMVLKLRGVNYYWKNEQELRSMPNTIETDKEGNETLLYSFGDEKQIGVIAQDVEAILPELVKTDANGFKTVDYTSLTPVLIEAIKELKGEKDALQKEVDALKAQMEEILKLLNK